MNRRVFFGILAVGIALVVVQGIASWLDGWLTQTQISARGIANGWSLMEHGGVWADAFIMSPILAYVASKYQLEYYSRKGRAMLTVAILISLSAGYAYHQVGTTMPEAHTHYGVTTLAGWIHGLFAVAAIWVCGMAYLGMTSPRVSRSDLVAISLILTPFFYLGVKKFSDRWVLTTEAKWQIALEIILLWAITFIRLRSA